MSTLDGGITSTTSTDSTDISVPLDDNRQPLSWDGNNARILGLLHDIWRHYQRNGIFVTFIQKRAKVLSSGKLAVEAVSTVPLVAGTVQEEERTLTTMCPPAAERIAQANDWRGRRTPPLPPYTAITTMPAEYRDSMIVQPLFIIETGGKLLGSLHHVFGHAEPSKDLFDDAHGDPYALVTELIARANRADTADQSVVLAEFDAVRAGGITGELTLDKIATYCTRYVSARASLAPASRPSPAAEVQMINLIAFKDSSVRELYALRTATPPTTFAAAISVLKSILTTRLRAEQLDSAVSGGAPQLGLIAQGRPVAAQQPPAPPQPAATDATNTAALAALLAKFGVKDPNKAAQDLVKKGKKGKKGKIDIPRDSNNQIMRWVEGMSICKCGINGGKHLFRDCPKKAQEKEAAAKQAEAAAKPAAPTVSDAAAADLLTSLGSMSKEDLLAQVSALLGGNANTVAVGEIVDAADAATSEA